MRKRARLVALALAAAGCADAFSVDDLRELAAAQERWRQSGTTYYEYEVRVGCFCPPELNGWSLVTVDNDSIISVVPRDTSLVVAPDRYTMWPTVNELFAAAARRSGGGWRVSASYDPAYGYPVMVDIREPPGMADGSVVYEARNLLPLRAP